MQQVSKLLDLTAKLWEGLKSTPEESTGELGDYRMTRVSLKYNAFLGFLNDLDGLSRAVIEPVTPGSVITRGWYR